MKRMLRTWPIIFCVEGLNIERFIRRAGEERIHLLEIKRLNPRKLQAVVREEQLPALQEMAIQGGWKFIVGRRIGIGRTVEWMHSRWLLVSAVLIGAIALLAASQVMWQVRIVDGGAYDADIRAALNEWGIAAPMLKSQVDIGKLRDDLEWRYPRIAWFECGWRGSALVVRPVEGRLPRTDGGEAGAGDIVASRDGIVHKIVTIAGTSAVKTGDIVRAGDVLIKGEERTSDGGIRTVSARGSVMARVWKGASVIVPGMEQATDYTGRSETVWTISTPWFDLWPMEASCFEQYDTAVTETRLCSFLLPITVRTEKRMEAVISVVRRAMDEMEQSGKEAAKRKLHENLSQEESLIDIWGNCSMIEDGNLLSVAIGEMLVEIGIRSSSPEMAAPGGNEPR